MNEPLVHVVIINWNGREHLRTCFDSLLASPYENVEYVLVDNGSTDGSAQFVREQYSDERIVIVELGKNLGWSGGNNAGMLRALELGAKYLFLINNDTWTAPDALRLLVEHAEATPAAGALAPKMVLFDAPQILNSVGLECSISGSAWDRGVGRLDTPEWNRRVEVAGVCGGACFLRADAVRAAGLLPESFGIYLDDLDLCLRIWAAGYTIETFPEAVVRHKFSATMGSGKSARRKYYLNTRNRFRVMLRNFPAREFPRIAGRVLQAECRAVGRALLDAEFWRAGAHLRAWGSALAYLPSALLARGRWRRQGFQREPFWRLIRHDLLFCPRIELPRNGWYAERQVRGRWVRPMSRTAWEDVPRGGLRIIHANPYPYLGEAHVTVSIGGLELAVLRTRDLADTVLRVPEGRIDFESKRIFNADDTGEAADFGGWITIERV